MFIKIYKFIWEQKKLYRGKVLLILGVLLVSALFSDVLIPYVMGKLVDKFEPSFPGMNYAQLISFFGLLILGYFLFRYLSTVCWIIMRKAFNHVEGYTLEATENRIRAIMFGKSMDFFNKKFSGSLTNKETKFTRAYERLYDEFTFNIWPTSWRFLGVVILLFFVSPMFSWIILAYGTIYIVFMYKFSKYKFKYDEKASRETSKMTGRIADIYTNILAIKLFASEEYEQRKFEQQNHRRLKARLKAWKLGNTRDNIVSLFNDTAMIVIMIGAVLSWNQGALTIGEVVLLLTYSNQLRMYMHNFGNAIKSTMVSYSDMVEMMEYIEIDPQSTNTSIVEPCRISEGKIEFKSISFAYEGTERKVFDNFSLTIEPGQKIALVGESGSGKSTLVKLIPRLHEIIEGDILIDGQSIKSMTLHDLRRKISSIPQEPNLFHRTVKENIKNNREDASMEEIERAAERACAKDFITKELERGYETVVGERGVMLSGGQKQRVALAGALLQDTPILLLDEATSAIDAIKEKDIQQALHNLSYKRTTIVIAHRLSTVMDMDRVVVMSEGAIVEDGTPQELLQAKGAFYTLWRAQQNPETLKHQIQLLTDSEKRVLFAEAFPQQKIPHEKGLTVSR